MPFTFKIVWLFSRVVGISLRVREVLGSIPSLDLYHHTHLSQPTRTHMTKYPCVLAVIFSIEYAEAFFKNKSHEGVFVANR